MFTVLGATGFIGKALLSSLRADGVDCVAPDRNDWAWLDRDAGHIIYSIGLTADFRWRPWDTLKGHVCQLVAVLEKGRFESLLYLSSTRVYGESRETSEHVSLQASPLLPGDLYNLSKLAGEAACFAHPSSTVRVARLSNIYGPDSSENFLSSLIRQALSGEISLQTSPDSEKDYLSVEAAVRYLVAIAQGGRERLYNVAAGRNTSNAAITEGLAVLTHCRVRVEPDAPTVRFAPIDIRRLTGEFGESGDSLLKSLGGLVDTFRGATDR